MVTSLSALAGVHAFRKEPRMTSKGLLMVFTGTGKGKTTAALGLALRAMGHGFRVCVVQFIKGSWKYGELDSVRRFSDLMDFHVAGRGFTRKSEDLEEDRTAAREGWRLASEAIASGKYHTVILDELTYPIHLKMLDEKEVVDRLMSRPPGLHIVVTGRNAPSALLAAADLITDMQAVKHPYAKGVKAQKGVEF